MLTSPLQLSIRHLLSSAAVSRPRPSEEPFDGSADVNSAGGSVSRASARLADAFQEDCTELDAASSWVADYGMKAARPQALPVKVIFPAATSEARRSPSFHEGGEVSRPSNNSGTGAEYRHNFRQLRPVDSTIECPGAGGAAVHAPFFPRAEVRAGGPRGGHTAAPATAAARGAAAGARSGAIALSCHGEFVCSPGEESKSDDCSLAMLATRGSASRQSETLARRGQALDIPNSVANGLRLFDNAADLAFMETASGASGVPACEASGAFPAAVVAAIFCSAAAGLTLHSAAGLGGAGASDLFLLAGTLAFPAWCFAAGGAAQLRRAAEGLAAEVQKRGGDSAAALKCVSSAAAAVAGLARRAPPAAPTTAPTTAPPSPPPLPSVSPPARKVAAATAAPSAAALSGFAGAAVAGLFGLAQSETESTDAGGEGEEAQFWDAVDGYEVGAWGAAGPSSVAGGGGNWGPQLAPLTPDGPRSAAVWRPCVVPRVSRAGRRARLGRRRGAEGTHFRCCDCGRREEGVAAAPAPPAAAAAAPAAAAVSPMLQTPLSPQNSLAQADINVCEVQAGLPADASMAGHLSAAAMSASALPAAASRTVASLFDAWATRALLPLAGAVCTGLVRWMGGGEKLHGGRKVAGTRRWRVVSGEMAGVRLTPFLPKGRAPAPSSGKTLGGFCGIAWSLTNDVPLYRPLRRFSLYYVLLFFAPPAVRRSVLFYLALFGTHVLMLVIAGSVRHACFCVTRSTRACMQAAADCCLRPSPATLWIVRAAAALAAFAVLAHPLFHAVRVALRPQVLAATAGIYTVLSLPATLPSAVWRRGKCMQGRAEDGGSGAGSSDGCRWSRSLSLLLLKGFPGECVRFALAHIIALRLLAAALRWRPATAAALLVDFALAPAEAWKVRELRLLVRQAADIMAY